MNYNFFMPAKFISGENCVIEHSHLMKRLGDRCLVVTGKSSAVKSGALADLQSAFEKEGIAYTLFDEVEPNPLVKTCWRAGKQGKAFGAQFVVGIGGGSPLDAAKAAAVFAANDLDYMEIYSTTPATPVLPIVAIGTTAGTGSEVSPFSVLTEDNGRKRSMGGDKCFATVSYGDPRYTYSLSRRFTIGTALDALAHALEGYFNNAANGMSDIFAVQSTAMLVKALPQLEKMQSPEDASPELRAELYNASVLAGITLAHTGTIFCHRLGYFLSEDYGVPHGTACAVFLPHLIRRSVKLIPERTENFFRQVGCAPEELCELIERLTEYDLPVLNDAQMEEIAKRGVGANNYLRTMPDGFPWEEAYQLLQERYSGK